MTKKDRGSRFAKWLAKAVAGHRPLHMGIINVAPDSFSDGGQFLSADHAVTHGHALRVEGAILSTSAVSRRGRAPKVQRTGRAGTGRGELWGPRTIDIAILLYGERQVDEPELTIPHQRIHERTFVLCPLAEILPDAMISGCTVNTWSRALDLTGIQAVEDAYGTTLID